MNTETTTIEPPVTPEASPAAIAAELALAARLLRSGATPLTGWNFSEGAMKALSSALRAA